MNWLKYPKKKKVDGYRKLMHKLDAIFSKYIRLRDADESGMCKCITCGEKFFWKKGDAGHFISRDRIATRWDQRNVNAQCPRCNRFRGGEQYLHGIAIDRIHGKGTAELLKNLSLVRGTKINILWLENEIEIYKDKLKELEKFHNVCG